MGNQRLMTGNGRFLHQPYHTSKDRRGPGTSGTSEARLEPELAGSLPGLATLMSLRRLKHQAALIYRLVTVEDIPNKDAVPEPAAPALVLVPKPTPIAARLITASAHIPSVADEPITIGVSHEGNACFVSRLLIILR